ncbi:MAG: magnesium transporter CorA family protein [Candidatus Methanomethylophilaceae archaeon]|nr:magnesium transporter CorA family protein [Candidatus Methanomethylophilaceae archaeon]
MMRSYAFTTQGRLHSSDLEPFLMPTLLSDTNLFLWVDMENPTPNEIKWVLEDIFHFHPLSIEDCIQDSPSPKLDEYVPKEGDTFNPYLFIVLHAVDYSRRDGVFDTSEMNFFIGRNFIVTFHYVSLKAIQYLAERCERAKSLAARTPDHLAHLLMDAVVEHYTPAVDELGSEVGVLESRVLESDEEESELLNEVIKIRKEVYHLRQIIMPQKEVMAKLSRPGYKLIRPNLLPYYRDVYDRLSYLSDMAMNYADSLTNILKVYLYLSSNRTEEIIKTLALFTILTTPTLAIGAWYGMNLRFWEIGVDNPWSPYWVLGLNIVLTLVIFIYIRRKKWF